MKTITFAKECLGVFHIYILLCLPVYALLIRIKLRYILHVFTMNCGVFYYYSKRFSIKCNSDVTGSMMYISLDITSEKKQFNTPAVWTILLSLRNAQAFDIEFNEQHSELKPYVVLRLINNSPNKSEWRTDNLVFSKNFWWFIWCVCEILWRNAK